MQVIKAQTDGVIKIALLDDAAVSEALDLSSLIAQLCEDFVVMLTKSWRPAELSNRRLSITKGMACDWRWTFYPSNIARLGHSESYTYNTHDEFPRLYSLAHS